LKPAFAHQVSVESPTMTDGLRVDHPRLKEYILNGLKLGWNNEHIIKVTGAPQELVGKVRHQYEKEKMKP
jgi:hypothetical protein